jgi:hypothetical protein
MAIGGFKKKLPMSAALRQGGEGTVPPPKPRAKSLGSSFGGAGEFGIQKPPKGAGGVPGKPTQVGGGISMNKAQSAAKAPTAPNIKVGPKMPSMPKMPKIK